VARLNESMVIQLGCVNQGFSNPELQALPMTLEMLEELSDCGWLQAQVPHMNDEIRSCERFMATQIYAMETSSPTE